MTTDNEQVYILVGEPEVYDQHGGKLETLIRADRPEGVFISVHVPSLEPKQKLESFMPGVTLTKPSIRVPVWGQEFIVSNPRLEKGQICVDVTPPVIKDQFGNVLAATSWTNDTITVKTVPGSQYIQPIKLDQDRLERIAKMEADNASMKKDMDEWREKYRQEHERANKLQDSEAKFKRLLIEAQDRLALVNEELKELRAFVSKIKSAITGL